MALFTAFVLLAAPAAAQEGSLKAAPTEAAPPAAAATPAAAAPPAKETPAAPAAEAQAPAAEKPGEPLAAPTAAPKSDLDFDLLPESTAPKEDKELESQLKTRRSMLLIHQGLGIATFLLITTAVVFGQLNYDDRFGGGQSTGTYETWHSGFAAAGTICFIGAGTLALLAPVPIAKRGDFDTITVHKWSMLVAAIGFAAEIPLGIYTVSQEGYANQASLALAHLIIGYITAAALGVGTAALLF